ALQYELILRPAHRGIDGEVLDGLHIERDAADLSGFLLQSADDVAGGELARVVRLQVDQEPAAVERRVRAVDADEGREAVDVRVLQNGGSERLLTLRHRGI